jgi:formylglycine-generating enzyme required for sulfatase activity
LNKNMFHNFMNSRCFWASPLTVLMTFGFFIPTGLFAEPKQITDCESCPILAVISEGEIDIRLPPGALGRGHNVGWYQRVIFTQPFAIGIYEVTNAQWHACISDGGCELLDYDTTINQQHPVTQVSWQQANEYTKWLTKKTGHTYRLPSNAEWEYAARGDLGMNRYFNLEPTDVCIFGNVYDQTAEAELAYGLEALPCSDQQIMLAPVGSFKANQFGIFDAIGNAFEWTEDCPNPGGQGRGGFPTTGKPWLDGDCSLRGYRGSSWLTNEPYYLTESTRFKDLTSNEEDLGFRVVRELRD